MAMNDDLPLPVLWAIGLGSVGLLVGAGAWFYLENMGSRTFWLTTLAVYMGVALISELPGPRKTGGWLDPSTSPSNTHPGESNIWDLLAAARVALMPGAALWAAMWRTLRLIVGR